MEKTAVCGTCFREKPRSHFYQTPKSRQPVSEIICKACMHGPSPSGLSPVSIPASFAAGLADVIDQIGRMRD